jgi:uncharacterized protein (DUF342 family)
MADEQSPSVEIAPTVIISNSDEGENNAAHSGDSIEPNSGDEHSSSVGDDNSSQSEQVVIAAIEAERDVALAEIHSDVERERIAVEAERIETVSDTNEELNKCREEIAVLAEKLATLENLLIPPPPLEIVATEELPIVEETDLIHPSTVVPIAETQTEHSEESVEERLEEAIPSRVRKFIAI